MIGLLCFVLAVLASPFKSKMRLEAENAVLRHQLIILRRKLRGRVQLANSDRWFFVQLYPDSTIVRKTACHGAILGFVMGHDLRRLFVSRRSRRPDRPGAGWIGGASI